MIMLLDFPTARALTPPRLGIRIVVSRGLVFFEGGQLDRNAVSRRSSNSSSEPRQNHGNVVLASTGVRFGNQLVTGLERSELLETMF